MDKEDIGTGDPAGEAGSCDFSSSSTCMAGDVNSLRRRGGEGLSILSIASLAAWEERITESCEG